MKLLSSFAVMAASLLLVADSPSTSWFPDWYPQRVALLAQYPEAQIQSVDFSMMVLREGHWQPSGNLMPFWAPDAFCQSLTDPRLKPYEVGCVVVVYFPYTLASYPQTVDTWIFAKQNGSVIGSVPVRFQHQSQNGWEHTYVLTTPVILTNTPLWQSPSDDFDVTRRKALYVPMDGGSYTIRIEE